jgi:hypothetical protein
MHYENAVDDHDTNYDQRDQQSFILVLECLPGIISVPLPGHFALEGSNLNERH